MSEPNFEIDTDAGCDYECMIWETHHHITVVDRTPPDPLEEELWRAKRAVYREVYRERHGHYPMGIFPNLVDELFALSPLDTPFLEIMTARKLAEEDFVFNWEGLQTEKCQDEKPPNPWPYGGVR